MAIFNSFLYVYQRVIGFDPSPEGWISTEFPESSACEHWAPLRTKRSWTATCRGLLQSSSNSLSATSTNATWFHIWYSCPSLSLGFCRLSLQMSLLRGAESGSLHWDPTLSLHWTDGCCNASIKSNFSFKSACSFVILVATFFRRAGGTSAEEFSVDNQLSMIVEAL